MNAEKTIVRLIAKGKTVKNVTVAIADDCYRSARVWAAQNDTSVSAIVQDMLYNLPRLARAYDAAFVNVAAPQPQIPANNGPEIRIKESRKTVKTLITKAKSTT
jgi:hypothetical protein